MSLRQCLKKIIYWQIWLCASCWFIAGSQSVKTNSYSLSRTDGFWMILDCERKLANSERTHTFTWRTYNFLTSNPWPSHHCVALEKNKSIKKTKQKNHGLVCRHRNIALSSNNCLWREHAGAAESPLTLTKSPAVDRAKKKKSLIENVMQWFCWAIKISLFFFSFYCSHLPQRQVSDENGNLKPACTGENGKSQQPVGVVS